MKRETRLSYDKYVTYCEKIGMHPLGSQGPYEVGVHPGEERRRTDLTSFTDEMAAGKSLVEVALANPTTYVKYHSGFQKLAYYMGQDAASEWRTVHVEVLYGATGVGKTRAAIELAKTMDGGWFLMRKDDGKTMWWDGYTGQHTIILDEFHGNWMRYKGLLGTLDGHPYRVPIKGGHEWARWTKVIITSTTSFQGWFAREDYSELERRINKVTHVDPLAVVAQRPEARSGGNTSPTTVMEDSWASANLHNPSQALLDLGGYNADDVAFLDEYGRNLLIADEEIDDILGIPQNVTSTSS